MHVGDASGAPVNPALIAELADRDQMLSDLYHELRAAAGRLLRMEAPDLTMQPTELVNEAALRIMKVDRMEFVDRRHFFATGAGILRQAMVDAIRRRDAAKRRAPTVFLDGDNDELSVDIDVLDAALNRLDAASPELSRIVELRFFVGLSVKEVARLLGQSERTVKRRWQTARLWLAAELEG